MKQILLILIIAGTAACFPATKETDNQQQSELEAATVSAENSPVTDTICFLGFAFGMTQTEVSDHFSELHKTGKIYYNRSRKHQYDFGTTMGDAQVTFIPEYFEGELYRMTYPCEIFGDSRLAWMLINDAFHDGEPKRYDTWLINTNVLDETYYTYYRNNLIVTFKEGYMIYENAPISKLAKEKKDEANAAKYKQSISEF